MPLLHVEACATTCTLLNRERALLSTAVCHVTVAALSRKVLGLGGHTGILCGNTLLQLAVAGDDLLHPTLIVRITLCQERKKRDTGDHRAQYFYDLHVLPPVGLQHIAYRG